MKTKAFTLTFSSLVALILVLSLSLNSFAGLGYATVTDDLEPMLMSAASSYTTVLDISEYQPTVNWTRVSSAVDGIILRIGYRGYETLAINPDKCFQSHYTAASAKGMDIGCYFYSVALTSSAAKDEAEWVIDRLDELNCEMTMPIYFDMENFKQKELSKSLCTRIAKRFCETIADAGYYAGIYCSKAWAEDLLDMSQLSDYTVWIAQWDTTCTYGGSYDMWQYTDSGTVNGISGDVDLSRCYVDFPTIIKDGGFNGFSPSPGPEPATPTDDSDDSSGRVYRNLFKLIIEWFLKGIVYIIHLFTGDSINI